MVGDIGTACGRLQCVYDLISLHNGNFITLNGFKTAPMMQAQLHQLIWLCHTDVVAELFMLQGHERVVEEVEDSDLQLPLDVPTDLGHVL